jgi:hypothetical protein
MQWRASGLMLFSKAVGANRRRLLYQDLATPSQKPLCGYGEKNGGFLEDVATLLYSFQTRNAQESDVVMETGR